MLQSIAHSRASETSVGASGESGGQHPCLPAGREDMRISRTKSQMARDLTCCTMHTGHWILRVCFRVKERIQDFNVVVM